MRYLKKLKPKFITIEPEEKVINASLKVIYADFRQNFAGDIFPYNAYCPRCSHSFDPKNDRWIKYCPMCGQKLDWGDENE